LCALCDSDGLLLTLVKFSVREMMSLESSNAVTCHRWTHKQAVLIAFRFSESIKIPSTLQLIDRISDCAHMHEGDVFRVAALMQAGANARRSRRGVVDMFRISNRQ